MEVGTLPLDKMKWRRLKLFTLTDVHAQLKFDGEKIMQSSHISCFIGIYESLPIHTSGMARKHNDNPNRD